MLAGWSHVIRQFCKRQVQHLPLLSEYLLLDDFQVGGNELLDFPLTTGSDSHQKLRDCAFLTDDKTMFWGLQQARQMRLSFSSNFKTCRPDSTPFQHGRPTIPSRFMSPTWWAKTFGRKEPSTVGSCPSSLHHTLFSVSHPPSGPNQVASGLKTPPIFEELTDSQRFSEGGSVQHDEFQLHPFR